MEVCSLFFFFFSGVREGIQYFFSYSYIGFKCILCVQKFSISYVNDCSIPLPIFITSFPSFSFFFFFFAIELYEFLHILDINSLPDIQLGNSLSPILQVPFSFCWWINTNLYQILPQNLRAGKVHETYFMKPALPRKKPKKVITREEN